MLTLDFFPHVVIFLVFRLMISKIIAFIINRENNNYIHSITDDTKMNEVVTDSRSESKKEIHSVNDELVNKFEESIHKWSKEKYWQDLDPDFKRNQLRKKIFRFWRDVFDKGYKNHNFTASELTDTVKSLTIYELMMFVMIEEMLFGCVYFTLRLYTIRSYATYITVIIFTLVHGLEVSYRGGIHLIFELFWLSSISHMRNMYGWEGSFVAHLVNNWIFTR